MVNTPTWAQITNKYTKLDIDFDVKSEIDGSFIKMVLPPHSVALRPFKNLTL